MQSNLNDTGEWMMNDLGRTHPHGDASPAFRDGDEAAEAIDALAEVGFDPAKVSDKKRSGAGMIARLLSLLDMGDAGADPSLADATMARVLRTPRRGDDEPALSSMDHMAVESWVMHEYDGERVPTSLRDRARRLVAMREDVVNVPGVAASENLVELTLARVQAEADAQSARMTIEPARPARGSLRLADLVSVAAVLMIGAAVVWPVLSAVRHESRRMACLSNMGNAALAFDQYAGSHRDSLPVATASLDGRPWWNVGAADRRSNSANLYELTRTGYAKLADLACPGNPAAPREAARPDQGDWQSFDEVSYSYQIMFGPMRITWSAPVRGVVIADRSPVIARAIRGDWIDPNENSMNHGGRGQHILFSDGSSQWRRTPELESMDNIWLPRGLEQLIDQATGRRDRLHLYGTETPTAVDDAFVGP